MSLSPRFYCWALLPTTLLFDYSYTKTFEQCQQKKSTTNIIELSNFIYQKLLTNKGICANIRYMEPREAIFVEAARIFDDLAKHHHTGTLTVTIEMLNGSPTRAKAHRDSVIFSPKKTRIA